MSYTGIVLHHSVCPSINGSGYDFFIALDGTIIPAPKPVSATHFHICIEGDFSKPVNELSAERKEQLFLLSKLIMRLNDVCGWESPQLFRHSDTCPGPCFPWDELVISDGDRYH